MNAASARKCGCGGTCGAKSVHPTRERSAGILPAGATASRAGALVRRTQTRDACQSRVSTPAFDVIPRQPHAHRFRLESGGAGRRRTSRQDASAPLATQTRDAWQSRDSTPAFDVIPRQRLAHRFRLESGGAGRRRTSRQDAGAPLVRMGAGVAP
jgi:hypothetical protein